MNLVKLVLAATASLALNAGHPGPRPPAPSCPFMEMAGPLELTPKQLEQIQQAFDAHAKSLEAKRSEARKAQHALMRAMGDPSLNPEQLRTLAAKEAQAHLDELLEAHALLKETAALLTQEQQKKLAKLRSEHPFPGHGGPGHPGHGNPGHPGMMPPPPPCEGM